MYATLVLAAILALAAELCIAPASCVATYEIYTRIHSASGSSTSSPVERVASWSSIECSAQCSSAGERCKSALYVPSDGVCLMSEKRAASFPHPHGDSRPFVKGSSSASEPLGYSATIGSRTYRVIQQRMDNSVSFSRSWSEYVTGFGDANNFWIGLSSIHNLTGTGTALRVETTRWNGKFYTSEYETFKVNSLATNYSVDWSILDSGRTNSSYPANFDPLFDSLGRPFSTTDNDNDQDPDSFVAKDWAGGAGWWFTYPSSIHVNPNGLYPAMEQAICGFTNVSMKYMHWYYNDTACSRVTVKSMRMMLLV